ncbi:hypothetical protein ACIPSA_25890 [Streptomyces sp. NPDC086549]|uniref:hypothetical protein n=1 Tax=Streptomyces sp. NPDC086549 TaxID=3365752 RepID=UPI00381B9A50
MPKILTVELSAEQQAEVRRRLNERDLPCNERRRLECIRLPGRGLILVAQGQDIGEELEEFGRQTIQRSQVSSASIGN